MTTSSDDTHSVASDRCIRCVHLLKIEHTNVLSRQQGEDEAAEAPEVHRRRVHLAAAVDVRAVHFRCPEACKGTHTHIDGNTLTTTAILSSFEWW